MWLAYGTPAFLAFVYRAFVAPRTSRQAYSVVNVRTARPAVVELTLETEMSLLEYRPGQFIYLTPLDPKLPSGRNEEHPYTLSSAPHEPVLRVVIKDLGDATHALQEIALRSRVLIEGPYGDFFPSTGKTTRELWIAGGIGLTPFLSRARSFAQQETVTIHLIYCIQDETRADFLSELQEIASRVPGFKVEMHFFDREGPLSASFLASHCPDFTTREIYVCGPPPLISMARKELRLRGVPSMRIHYEDFAWL
jgi:predicted ferric reductase